MATLADQHYLFTNCRYWLTGACTCCIQCARISCLFTILQVPELNKVLCIHTRAEVTLYTGEYGPVTIGEVL